MRNHSKLLAPTAPSSSSKNNNSNRAAEQPHLSGAYIRSLVKQLSSSSSAARSKDHGGTMVGTNKPHSQQPPQQQDQQQAQTTAPPPQQQQQQQPHKKQVRRRLHTSRPYQERLLNMAEARREIVTALKIHRASMRQAKEQQQQQQQQLMQLQLQRQQDQAHLVQEQSQEATNYSSRAASLSAMTTYASSYSSDYLYNSPFSHFTAAPSSYYSSPLITYDAPLITPPMVNPDHDDQLHSLDLQLVPLPAQPLGLNLSFQGFNSFVGDDTPTNLNNSSACSFVDPPSLLQPSPASSYSVYSSPSVTMAGGHDLSSAVTTENTSSLPAAEDASLHRVLDDEEMAAIYSIGQQHDIEWSDTVNLVTSAWWSKLLESIEDKGSGTTVGQEAGGGAATMTTMEDQLQVDMPDDDWVISENLAGHEATEESNSDFPGIHDSCYHQDEGASLPRMDIGDIEGWDTEWFS